MNPRGYLTASKAWDAERAGRLFNIDDWHALTPAQREHYAHAEHLPPFNDSLMAAVTLSEPLDYQRRVSRWVVQCFGAAVADDRTERGDRFIEEAFELLQSHGYDPARIAVVRDYVWGRFPGDPVQELGGTMVTLAAYCRAFGLDMHEAGETELARVMQPEVLAKVRAKQALKKETIPFSALPSPAEADALLLTERVDDALIRYLGLADAVSLTPNGSGGMKVTVNFDDHTHAGLLFKLLMDLLPEPIL